MFRLWPLYPAGVKIESKWHQYVLKHAEMQSETPGVQSFAAKFGASMKVAYNLKGLLFILQKFCNNFHIDRRLTNTVFIAQNMLRYEKMGIDNCDPFFFISS